MSRLLRRLAVLAILLSSASAAADMDAVTLRGNYWRDRNTRVVQPAIDIAKQLPTGTQIGAHYLLDAITSASVAAGVLRDQPFTELRNEAGFMIGQNIGPVLLSGSYSYSSESDYWSHFANLGVLWTSPLKNTQISASLGYSNDRVALRMGPTLYNPIGGLQTVRGVATLTQTLTPSLLLTASYEIGVLGFGTIDNGWQANVYRTVNTGGAPARESVPYQRIREAAAAALYWHIAVPSRIMPYLAFRPAYRLYWDDWGLLSHTPELRMYVPTGPVEWRVTGRYYIQNHVSFWRDDGVRPAYLGADASGVGCPTCFLASSKDGHWFTSDPKLGNMRSAYFELGVLIHMSGFHRLKWLPGHDWLGAGIIQLSYGHYVNSDFAHTAFGDADVAGLTLEWPL
ncbi:MAG TPA: DUF3570 domain-containing protein [Polyangia bacterium]|nr:DUF3570 domain-containing protein [Polyangia bacterium]